MEEITDSNVDTALVVNLLTLSFYLTRHEEDFLLKSKITVKQWIVLMYIHRSTFIDIQQPTLSTEFLMASEIADLRNLSRPSISNHIKQLKLKGLITNYTFKNDRRKKSLKITPSGRAKIRELERTFKCMEREVFEDLRENDKVDFYNKIKKCINTMYRY